MRKFHFIPRIFAILLSLAIALPNPAFALRQLEPTEDSRRSSQIRVGLEQSVDSSTVGLEETHQTAEILRSLQWGASSETDSNLVLEFVHSMKRSLEPRLESGILNRLTNGRPYVVGQWSLGEAEGTTEEEGLLAFILANIQRVLERAGAQLGFDPQQSLNYMGWETLRPLAENLFKAHDSNGIRLLGTETSVSTLIRLFYRDLLVEIVPRLASDQVRVRQEELIQVLKDPFREINQRRNQAMVQLVKELLRKQDLRGELFTDDPVRLRQNPQLLSGWIHLLVASNVTGQINPNWQEDPALMQSVYEIAASPFVWEEQAQIDKGRIQIRYLRLEEAIQSGHPAIRGLGLTSSRESFKWGSVRLGMLTAVEEGADVVVMTDADSGQRLTELPNLVAPILLQGSAAVIGSRFLPGGATSFLGVHNDIEFFLYNSLVRFSIPEIGSIYDVQSGFKAFPSQALRDALPEMRSYQLMGDSELLWLIARHGGAILEVPRSELEESRELSTVNPTRYLEFIQQLEQQLQHHGRPEGLPPAAAQLRVSIASLSPQIWSQREQAILAGVIDDIQSGHSSVE